MIPSRTRFGMFASMHLQYGETYSFSTRDYHFILIKEHRVSGNNNGRSVTPLAEPRNPTAFSGRTAKLTNVSCLSSYYRRYFLYFLSLLFFVSFLSLSLFSSQFEQAAANLWECSRCTRTRILVNVSRRGKSGWSHGRSSTRWLHARHHVPATSIKQAL